LLTRIDKKIDNDIYMQVCISVLLNSGYSVAKFEEIPIVSRYAIRYKRLWKQRL
jgi:hypothetical protein